MPSRCNILFCGVFSNTDTHKGLLALALQTAQGSLPQQVPSTQLCQNCQLSPLSRRLEEVAASAWAPLLRLKSRSLEPPYCWHRIGRRLQECIHGQSDPCTYAHRPSRTLSHSHFSSPLVGADDVSVTIPAHCARLTRVLHHTYPQPAPRAAADNGARYHAKYIIENATSSALPNTAPTNIDGSHISSNTGVIAHISILLCRVQNTLLPIGMK